MSRPLEVAVVGCGNMGAHHARVVAAHPECRLVAVLDPTPKRAAVLAARHAAEARVDVPEGVMAVVVAAPTHTHAALTRPQLAAGRWCLVEKPLAAEPAEADGLVHPHLAVGHVERFNPAVRAIGAVAPRFVEARRLVAPSLRARDVCVVLDLVVHDLDLLRMWSPGPVEIVDTVGISVRSGEVDVASVRLRTADGTCAHLSASRVAAVDERTVRIYEETRTTHLDLVARRATRGSGPLPLTDARDGLTAQWDAFVDAVRGRAPLPVTGRDGAEIVHLARRIRAVMDVDSGAARRQTRRLALA